MIADGGFAASNSERLVLEIGTTIENEVPLGRRITLPPSTRMASSLLPSEIVMVSPDALLVNLTSVFTVTLSGSCSAVSVDGSIAMPVGALFSAGSGVTSSVGSAPFFAGELPVSWSRRFGSVR